MPPRRDTSASESESKAKTRGTVSTQISASRANTKARHLALQNAQKEYLAKHIHSNGPSDTKLSDPLDFERFPTQALRSYRDKHLALHGVPESMTTRGYMLESRIGEKSFSYKHKNRISKPQLADLAKRHFLSTNVKESEVITSFLYKVKNQEKSFRLHFNQ